MKLIAKIRVLAMFVGVRAEFEPGASETVVEVKTGESKVFTLADLPQHDIEQLLAMDAIEDADAKAAEAGLKEFEAAREAVQAQAQSIAPAKPQEPSTAAGGKAAAKKAAG